MAGYVAMARLDGTAVRAAHAPVVEATVVGTRERVARIGSGSADAAEAGALTGAIAVIDVSDSSGLAERLDRLREQLAMMTFFLTDPNSWR